MNSEFQQWKYRSIFNINQKLQRWKQQSRIILKTWKCLRKIKTNIYLVDIHPISLKYIPKQVKCVDKFYGGIFITSAHIRFAICHFNIYDRKNINTSCFSPLFLTFGKEKLL